MGYNPYKLEQSSVDDVRNKFKEKKAKLDEVREVSHSFLNKCNITSNMRKSVLIRHIAARDFDYSALLILSIF